MNKYYTDERNVQVVLSLLKEYGIHKVIASPGTTNITLIASMQQDPFFEIYSAAEERSAAYMACGLAAESKEPVVLSCTGATASRNYLPGLTEAFYRKLPIIAITSTQSTSNIGHLVPQVIDRSSHPNDIVLLSEIIQPIKDDNDLWACTIQVNRALLALTHRGGGPVHLNLVTTYSHNFSVKTLPLIRKISRICTTDKFPDLPKGKIAVYVGAHKIWSPQEEEALDRFCAKNNAVVFCDHTSNYKGRYRILYPLVQSQEAFISETNNVDLLIHIGEISGTYAYPSSTEVWRVSEDGELRDFFKRLHYIFEMPEQLFFTHYATNFNPQQRQDSYLQACKETYDLVYRSIPENLPFSNIWIAKKMAPHLPEDSILHLGILNSLRSWNFFEIPLSITSNSNVGGFGIDGCVSTLIGASLAHKDRLHFGVFGDLAFFYDMNSVGNRHVGKNIRILLINNGKGTEFRQYNHMASAFGDDADRYMAAAGHYGNKSPLLVKHYAEDLGFTYICASDKESFEKVYLQFLTPEISSKPILFEVFTNNVDESNALKMIRTCVSSTEGKLRKAVDQIVPPSAKKIIKSIVKR
mgnify:CR=1 FL=1